MDALHALKPESSEAIFDLALRSGRYHAKEVRGGWRCNNETYIMRVEEALNRGEALYAKKKSAERDEELAREAVLKGIFGESGASR